MIDPALAIRTQLQALPEVPAPPGLASSILRTQRRRLLRLHVGAAAGVVALACIALLPYAAQDVAPPEAAGTFSAAKPPAAAVLQDDLRALDRTLQAAYDAGASEDDVAPLWTARARLLDAYQDAHQI